MRGRRVFAKPGPAGELGLIDAFLAPFALRRDGRGGARSGVIAGPGDDCAQLRPGRGQVLVATTDAVLDGVHFDLRRCTPEDAGWKALAVNLSDLAAAGARPRWFLCALGVPPGTNQSATVLRRMGAGMAQLSRRFDCALAGGNLTRARQWSLTITALGEARQPRARAGGRPGDLLVLVGTLGAAALGLQLLQRARRPAGAAARAAIAAQLRPWPLVEAGLAAAGLARAGIDVSDGLLRDLGHLCARSGCGALLDCGALPRLPAVVRAEQEAARAGAHPHALSLAGGEEYALLLAVAPARLARLQAALGGAGAEGAVIGRLERTPGVRLCEGGRALPLPARAGFDHLAGR